MINKLILGTAGLSGAPYGVSGRAVSLSDSVAVISHALACGFTAIDTAPTYGHAERAIGISIARRSHSTPSSRTYVYTKTMGDKAMAGKSVNELGLIPTFMWHNWTYGASPDVLPQWVSGITCYSHDFELSRPAPGSLFQCDWNILNQSANKHWTPFIARSVFLRGLLLGDGRGRLASDIEWATFVAKSIGTTLPALALWAALNNPKITNVVVGCSTIDEVDTILRILEKPVWTSTAIKILHVGGPETDPRTWK